MRELLVGRARAAAARNEGQASAAVWLRPPLCGWRQGHRKKAELQGALLVDPQRLRDSIALAQALTSRACGGGHTEATPASPTPAATVGMADALLREELLALKTSALNKRAREVGVDDEAMDAAADTDDPKEALIALFVDGAVILLGVGRSSVDKLTHRSNGGPGILAGVVSPVKVVREIHHIIKINHAR